MLMQDEGGLSEEDSQVCNNQILQNNYTAPRHLLDNIAKDLFVAYCDDVMDGKTDINYLSVAITLCARSTGVWTAINSISNIEFARSSRLAGLRESSPMTHVQISKVCNGHPFSLLGLDGLKEYSHVIVRTSNLIVSLVNGHHHWDVPSQSSDKDFPINILFPSLTSLFSCEQQQDLPSTGENILLSPMGTMSAPAKKTMTWLSLETSLMTKLKQHWAEILHSETQISQATFALHLLKALLKSVTPEHNPLKGGWRASGKGSDVLSKLGSASETYIVSATKELGDAMKRCRSSVSIEDTFSVHLRKYIGNNIENIPPFAC